MAEQSNDAAAKLKKLGERIRANFAKEHPATEQQVEDIRNVIRSEWEKERSEKTQSSAQQPPAKDKAKQPPEQDREL